MVTFHVSMQERHSEERAANVLRSLQPFNHMKWSALYMSKASYYNRFYNHSVFMALI